ncbi:alpha/beta hydrolase [Aureispira anguillae]|uniref:Lysophospholipase n=1 Tax=Aureispira anguillae TaxID=2864201 RepID=A0A916DNE8_9BACT|nr:lysophospholipase [Aureispira anguillae]BDS09834.1 lysophospholipase [Aureispira anguillae]
MKNKGLKVLGVLLLLLLLILVVVVEFVAPYAIVMPPRLVLKEHPERFPNGVFPTDFNLKTKVLDLQTSDKKYLSNYLVLSNLDSCRGTIIMLHGIGGCKEDYLGSAQNIARLGYNCLIYDARAHGQSEGEYCTFGFLEKEDVKTVVTAILKDNPTTKIGLWASSMGGAVALQALAIDQRIDFGIVESTFTSLPEVVYNYQKRYCRGIGLRWVSNRVLAKAGRIAGFDPFEVRPIDACTQIAQPILINHGDADLNIDIKYGKALFEALATENKQFYTVKGGGHDNLYSIGGIDYTHTIFDFMALNFK